MASYGDYVFGELLRQFRVREGISQEALANRIGRSRTAISLWERSRELPGYRGIVLKIAEELMLSNEDTDLLLYASDYPLEYDTLISRARSDPQRGLAEESPVAEGRTRYGDRTTFGVEETSGLPSLNRTSQFSSLIEEHTKNFVGRTFIFRAIESHVNDPEFPSGYIVITGEPGIGKTALLAKLVKDYGYIHHFNIALRNIRSARDFLGNVCTQLVDRYRLSPRMVTPEDLEDSGLLSQLLNEAAAKHPGQPIRILVDALDEAEDTGLLPGVNRLYLPETLPENVYFVATSRPKVDYHFDVRQRRNLHLSDKEPENEDDIRLYVRKFIREHAETMQQRIAEWGVTQAEFVSVMVDKSEGNFMYLVYVLGDIHDGRLTAQILDDIDHLPTGLRSYYRRHWASMRRQDPERFTTLYEPVVCILATVREPVSTAQVAEWTRLDPLRVKDVVRDWREFLNDESAGRGEPLYRLYHASFQDFLEDEVGLRPYHKMITDAAEDILRS